MPVRRIPPPEAKRLLDEEGYIYLDVRSIVEFEQGHPPGAFNVPLLHATGMGMSPNNEFLDVVLANFDKETSIVCGCKVGGRSLRAAQILQSAGFKNVVDMAGGMHGQFAPTGRLLVEGWTHHKLPTANSAEDGRSYDGLVQKK